MAQTTEAPSPTTIETDTIPSPSDKPEITYSLGAYQVATLAFSSLQTHHDANRLLNCWWVFIGKIEKGSEAISLGDSPA